VFEPWSVVCDASVTSGLAGARLHPGAIFTAPALTRGSSSWLLPKLLTYLGLLSSYVRNAACGLSFTGAANTWSCCWS
jgi:hypothetical protein